MRLRALLCVLVSFGVAACAGGEDATSDAAGTPANAEAPSGVAPDSADPPPSPGTLPDSGGNLPSETLRVVFLGTSLTAGYGLSDESARYTARIQARADSAGLPVRVDNAGVSGDTSAGGLRRLDWLLETPLDVLVVELGANDGLRGRDPDAMEDNLREIVRRTREAWPDARVVLVGMEAPSNMGPRYTEAFRSVFPRLAEELDVALVPFLLEGVAGVPELNQDDRIHPTAEGHGRMARTVWDVLGPILEREAAELEREREERAEGGGTPAVAASSGGTG